MEERIQNEYFAKKEQRDKETQRQEAKRKMRRTGRVIIYLAVLLLAISGIYKLATRKAVPPPGESFEAQSREHIDVGAQHPTYNSNPPSGGWHYAVPAKTGIYDVELPDEQIIHNLEHGHVWLAYKPDLTKDQIEALAEIAKDYGSRIIMTPRAVNDSPIAIVAWQHLLKMDTVDEPAIRRFVQAHRNIAGPERNIPDNDFKDWRGKATPTPVPAIHNN